jgi:hypothetical protein
VLLSSNPVIGNSLSIKVTSPKKETGTIVLYDAIGRRVRIQQMLLQKGDNYLTVQTPNGFTGQAVLQVKSESLNDTKQIIF